MPEAEALEGKVPSSVYRRAIYALAVGGVLTIALAAGWMMERSRDLTLDVAKVHLDNFAVVLAEQTRFALRADPAVADKLRAPQQSAESTSVDAFFADLYRGLELAYRGRVLVLREDGLLVAAVPPPTEGPDTRFFGDHPTVAHALSRGDYGSVQERGIVDPGPRLFAYRRVRDQPFVIVVSARVSEVLAPWRRSALLIGGGAAILMLLTAAGAQQLRRQLRVSGTLAEQVEEHRRRLQSIIDSAMDAIVTIDERQNIVIFNAAAERIFGCPAGEAVGGPLDRFIPPRFRETHREHVTRFAQSGVTSRRMGGDLTLSGLRADGTEFPIDASISAAPAGPVRLLTVILRDITARVSAAQALARSHEELRELYEGMHRVREAERTRIARELHDELGQSLAALKLDLVMLASFVPEGHAEAAQVGARAAATVDATVGSVRRIAADLRPVVLDDLGLAAAIEQLAFELEERSRIAIAVRCEGVPDVGDPLATAIYRMVQEALTNVVRHASATEVDILLRTSAGRLGVRVCDNGRGLHPDPRRRSHGLLGIRERARAFGGSARIHSPPEGGTVVEIEVPLDARNPGAAET